MSHGGHGHENPKWYQENFDVILILLFVAIVGFLFVDAPNNSKTTYNIQPTKYTPSVSTGVVQQYPVSQVQPVIEAKGNSGFVLSENEADSAGYYPLPGKNNHSFLYSSNSKSAVVATSSVVLNNQPASLFVTPVANYTTITVSPNPTAPIYPTITPTYFPPIITPTNPNPTPTPNPDPIVTDASNTCEPSQDNSGAGNADNVVSDPYFSDSGLSTNEVPFNPDNGGDFSKLTAGAWYKYTGGNSSKVSQEVSIPGNDNNPVPAIPSADSIKASVSTKGAIKIMPSAGASGYAIQRIHLSQDKLNKPYEMKVCVFGDANLAPTVSVSGEGLAIKRANGGGVYKMAGYLAGNDGNSAMVLPKTLDPQELARTQDLYWTLYRFTFWAAAPEGSLSTNGTDLVLSLSVWKNQYGAKYPVAWFMRPTIRALPLTTDTYVPPASAIEGYPISNVRHPQRYYSDAPGSWPVRIPKPELTGFVDNFASFSAGQSLDKNHWLLLNKAWGGNNNGVSGDNLSLRDIDDNSPLSFLRLNVFGGTDNGSKSLANGRPERNGAVMTTNNYYGSGSYFVCGKLPQHTGVVSAFWPFHYIYYAADQPGFWQEPNKIRNSEIDWEIPTSDLSNSVAPDYNIARANNWGGQLGGEGGEDSTRVNFDHGLNDGKFHEFGIVWYSGKDIGDGTRIPGYVKWTYSENCIDNPTIDNPQKISDDVGYRTLTEVTGASVGQDNIPYRAARFNVGAWFPASDSASCSMDGNCTSGYRAGGKYFEGWGGTPNFIKDSLDIKWVAIYPGKSILPGNVTSMYSGNIKNLGTYDTGISDSRDLWTPEVVPGWTPDTISGGTKWNGTPGAVSDKYPTK